MSGHLRAVPDPEDDSVAVGAWPVPVHAVPAQTATTLAPAAPPADPPADDDPGEEPPGEPSYLEEDGDEHQADEDDAAGEYEEGEQLAGRHGFTIPDLRPYWDVRPLAELGPLAVQVARQGGPPLLRLLGHLLRSLGRFLRSLGRMLAWYARGIGVLLALVAAWLSGNIGKRGSVGARLAGAGFALYAAVHLSLEYAAAPYVLLVLVLGVVVMAARGNIKPPEKKAPEKKGTKDGKAKSTPSAKGKGKAAGKAGAEVEDELPAEVEEEAPADKPRPGLLARLAARRQAPADSPADAPEGSPAEPGEEGDGEADEAPAEDPLTALIRKEIGGENGVHLRDLRPAMRKALPGLSQATDEELRATLVRAGYDPSRKFRARGHAGRAGVPRDQLPQLPSPGVAPGPSGDHSPGSGERLPPANSSPSGEQRRAAGEWTAEDLARGWRTVQDPDRPSATVIEQLPGGA